MEHTPRIATSIADIHVPGEVVELRYLKTRAGDPVCVECGPVNDLVVKKAFGLPGLKPKTLADAEAQLDQIKDAAMTAEQESAALMTVEGLMTVAPLILEAGTAFRGTNGEEIRPAFWTTADPRNGALPFRVLRVDDVSAMLFACMRQSGYITAGPGGPADDAQFPDRGRGGAAAGSGAGAPGADLEPEPAANGDQSDAAVRPDGDAGV